MESQREACYYWPLGQCSYGKKCSKEHHCNLDPSLPERREHDYQVPNAVGEGCRRCLQAGRECDKKGRGGADDPCSECRWFGGETCNCTISASSTYNDQLWGVMKIRRNNGYDLPTPKSREIGDPTKAPPAPMPDAKVKAGWKGETREQLLVKPNSILPSFVLKVPRAYLVPPRVSNKATKIAAHKANEAKKDAAQRVPVESEYPSPSSVPPLPPNLVLGSGFGTGIGFAAGAGGYNHVQHMQDMQTQHMKHMEQMHTQHMQIMQRIREQNDRLEREVRDERDRERKERAGRESEDIRRRSQSPTRNGQQRDSYRSRSLAKANVVPSTPVMTTPPDNEIYMELRESLEIYAKSSEQVGKTQLQVGLAYRDTLTSPQMQYTVSGSEIFRLTQICSCLDAHIAFLRNGGL